jgi:hypothetical protein
VPDEDSCAVEAELLAVRDRAPLVMHACARAIALARRLRDRRGGCCCLSRHETTFAQCASCAPVTTQTSGLLQISVHFHGLTGKVFENRTRVMRKRGGPTTRPGDGADALAQVDVGAVGVVASCETCAAIIDDPEGTSPDVSLTAKCRVIAPLENEQRALDLPRRSPSPVGGALP